MNSKLTTLPLKGMIDFPPIEMEKVNFLKSKINLLAQKMNYREYDLPILESWETYAVKSSEELLNEQSYNFIDRGERKILLRPEITPSLARMVAREVKQLALPLRWFIIGRCYRYERPQKGRFREFQQLNFDILGKKNFLYDLEILRVIIHLMKICKVAEKDYVIYYNHRGVVNLWLDWKEFDEEEKKSFFTLADKKNKLSYQEFIEQAEKKISPKKLNDFYNFFEAKKVQDLFHPNWENLYQEEELSMLRDWVQLEKTLASLNFKKVIFSPMIVRGFDYYTGLVFEVFDQSGEIQRSLFGGGRYDKLVSNYIKEEISGIGFGMGLPIFIMFLEKLKLLPSPNKIKQGYYIAPLDKNSLFYSLEVGEKLISAGHLIENAPVMSMSKHFTKAQNFTFIIFIGEEEVKEKKCTIKNLQTSKQISLPFNELDELNIAKG